MDIAAWLSGLGLRRYAETFEANDIDAAVLRTLTAEDLKELGVASLGHRKKLLEAIAALPETDGGPTAEERKSPVRPHGEAERRQLTVLFVDLVGSTELSGRLDPEDMGRVIGAYQACCTEVIERWSGHVAKYMGDGLLAYFGFPQAHEDDAERAARAGLELTAAVARMQAGNGPLAARVGIATGVVMVGELIGEGAAQEEAVVGETPNLAARLQGLAEPGAVVVAASTRQLLGDLFALAVLGPVRLKGFGEPLTAFRVEGEGGTEGRFEALHGRGLMPLVGREHELAMLLERWKRAKDGDGQIVLISGEPGIGKSRLIRALREELGGEPHVALSHFCSPHHVNSALHPIIAQLERAADFASDQAPETKPTKLEALLRRATDQLDEAVPLVAALLGIPVGDRYPALNLSPQRQKQLTFEVLLEQLAGLARDRPVLELYEDVHWIDPSTLELLDLLVERVRTLPALMVLTYRPEFSPTWAGQGHVTLLPLSRLGRRQGAAIAERLTDKTLPTEVLDQIVARTDGVPLFVEELTKTVLESGLLNDAGDRWELSGPLPPLAIPTTLHDSLMARLDRLAPVKGVAQTGAVIGREFSHELLAAVASVPQADLDSALDRLVSSELIFRRGRPPAAIYGFKHAMVQDAAYQSLLKSKRQRLHARIAQILDERFPQIVESGPELLAHHYTQAGLAAPAIEHWRKAGEKAARRAANREAIEHLHRALDLLEFLPDEQQRDAVELRVLTQLGPALMLMKGWAAPEVETAYTRARELARKLETSTDLVPPLVGLWLFFLSRGRFDAADETAEELFQLAEAADDPDLLLQAHHAAWPTPMLRGAFAKSYGHIEKGIGLYDPERHKHHAFVYMGHDPAVCAHALGAGVAWPLGFAERAQKHAQDALQLARRLGHPPTLAFALWFLGGAHAARGDSEAALATAEQLLRLSEEQKLLQTRASALMIGGWAMAQADQIEEGLKQLRAGLADWHRMGFRNYVHVFRCLLAESCMRAGRYAEALEHLADASAVGKEIGERWWEARIHHSRGQLLLHAPTGSRDKAAASFARSIRIARAQGARSLELRAATSLAQLWMEQGERRRAHDLLGPVYGWFSEGFDTAALKEAHRLLDELA